MVLLSEDNKRMVDIGTYDTWKALYSTVVSCIIDANDIYPNAIQFLNKGVCKGEKGYQTARELNLIRDKLASVSPNDAVYDIDNPSLVAPWKDNLSPVITSCANLFTTADGKDMFFEIVAILCYAEIFKVNIRCDD